VIALIITAVASVITALGGLVVSVAILIPMLRTARQTHEIVNQQRTDMTVYQRDLKRALNEAGVEIPDDQSLPGAGT
jgi:hypothetical protein